MAGLKTKETSAGVTDFLNSIEGEKKRKDSFGILGIMKEVTKEEPRMWGSSIIGFGNYHYKYASGHEGNTCLVGFSPRKQNIVLYLMIEFSTVRNVLKELGKHKTGKGCLYINKLEDVNTDILKQLILLAFESLKKIQVT